MLNAITRFRRNVERRATKILESVIAFSLDLSAVLESRVPSFFIEEEFPNSAPHRQTKYRDAEPPFPKMMQYSLSVEAMRLAKDFDCHDVSLSAECYFLIG